MTHAHPPKNMWGGKCERYGVNGLTVNNYKRAIIKVAPDEILQKLHCLMIFFIEYMHIHLWILFSS